MRHIYLAFGERCEFRYDHLRRPRFPQQTIAVPCIEVFFERREMPALERERLRRLRFNGCECAMDFLQPVNRLRGQAIGAMHGHEIAPTIDFPMRQVSAFEPDGVNKIHAE